MAEQPRLADNTDDLAQQFRETRLLTEALVSSLSDADASLQSMDDTSPAKWHLAHTTWFWETFLLRDHLPGYCLFDERWPFLFNSYYEAEGERVARGRRGMLSRPSLDEARDYRTHVTLAMEPLLARSDCADLIALGIAHEQQHQELLLTDMKHGLFQNPLGSEMFAGAPPPPSGADADNADWWEHPGGVAQAGHDGSTFAFDNEGPRHRVLLQPFALARRLVTNGEWLAFMADGGYSTSSLWLSDGWSWVQAHEVTAPLYWQAGEAGWTQFTHSGWQEMEAARPVTHISYYEADAFASWAGKRLPTEFEWEAVAQRQGADAAFAGHQLDIAASPLPVGGTDLFGDCWQWTRSAYLPYPRFHPVAGAIGEYNGKFMSGQFVLRGASCATPRGHSRTSYRNFFYPHQRWQFTGLRLAMDL
ncbi:ergothioneine biosynthesis protein EgtB [Porphyrobacter sp. GA68]|uniref:ergothioneine biosynthesis protein EgtB n=1 Tax=Porphyrobacter sp. GA68 TaxID=2883480 RepID=UPI001D192874|nr:ergothioneine biosynthesis protein EgtB [Porphyrobacter sp. GA68]